ncbi:hypothetical protein D9M71_226430 [compost metagenome]
MPHNYSSLTAIGLGRLCADLLGAEPGMRFECFAEGADGGRQVAIRQVASSSARRNAAGHGRASAS